MPKTAPVDEPAVEAQPDNPIQFSEPVSAEDHTAVVADTPEQQLLTEQQMAALHSEANRDNTKRDFTLKVLEARKNVDETPPAPPPVAPQMAEQTRLEMEAGRKMNVHHEKLAVHRPKPVPSAQDGRSTAVFRPGDYVPDQKKGQGYTQGRNL